MNTHSISMVRAVLTATTLAVVSMATALHAQISTDIGKVNVPFAFETSTGQHFKAGIYTITLENEHVVLVQSAKQGGLMLTRMEDIRDNTSKPKAIFHRYSDRYFLSDVVAAGRGGHLHFTESKAEKRAQLDASLTVPTNVELAMLEPAR